nr:EAL domain-containing protein [uncultured Cetobacterium sp.]
MKKIIIMFFSIFYMVFSQEYIPKNYKEKDILNSLKKTKLKIGLSNNKFYNNTFDNNESINDIIKDLFSNYLQLNVEYEILPFHMLQSKIEQENIDGIGLLERTFEREELLDFTDVIFENHLYVISKDRKINSLQDLNNGYIYYRKGTVYNKFLESILNNNDLKAKLIGVENLRIYTNGLVLTSNPVIYNPKYEIEVSHTAGTAIGMIKKYEELIPILNSALSRKYKNIINEKIERINKKLSLENFNNSLTAQEKKYLESLKNINVTYDPKVNSLLYYFLPKAGVYKGVAPNILNTFGNLLDIKINRVPLDSDDIDIEIFSKTEEREKNYIFSNKIYDVKIYQVSLGNHEDLNTPIGVIDGSIEEFIAKKYNLKKNIIKYKSLNSLKKALNTNKVKSILVLENDFDLSKYNITFYETAPINFAFSKNNELLKNIINKSLFTIIDNNKILEKSIIERENHLLTEEIKDQNTKNLLVSISIFLFLSLLVIITKMILDNKHKKELLKDPLSGLPNRSVFNEFCSNESEDISGYSFITDIDNFKDLNDKYGHEFGDSIIKELSYFLKNTFETSYIFRISGDEFYGVFIESLENIISKLELYKLHCPLLKKYNISFSVGLHKKSLDTNINLSLKYADMALFNAKKIKGFSYKLADQKFIEEKERELKVLELLEGDLTELYAVYQPKISILSGNIIGGESLVRCKSPVLGDVYPNELIPIAETFDLIHRIDYKVAEETIKFVKDLVKSQKIADDFRISFNISVKTFLRDDLIETIEKLLKKYNVSGKYIEVEITESILVKDIKNILLKLGSLINLSIQISLDDFTAGHSTAGLLPILPISIIKFDKSLLDSLDENEEKAKIVYENLASLVKNLNLKIVSEGIETQEQLEFLRKINIDYGQGYLISRPLLKDDFLKFILK